MSRNKAPFARRKVPYCIVKGALLRGKRAPFVKTLTIRQLQADLKTSGGEAANYFANK